MLVEWQKAFAERTDGDKWLAEGLQHQDQAAILIRKAKDSLANGKQHQEEAESLHSTYVGQKTEADKFLEHSVMPAISNHVAANAAKMLLQEQEPPKPTGESKEAKEERERKTTALENKLQEASKMMSELRKTR